MYPLFVKILITLFRMTDSPKSFFISFTVSDEISCATKAIDRNSSFARESGLFTVTLINNHSFSFLFVL